jgi:hypothetical protein
LTLRPLAAPVYVYRAVPGVVASPHQRGRMVVVSGLYDVSSPKVIRFVGRIPRKDRACKLLTRAENLHSTRSDEKIVEAPLASNPA